MSTAVVWNEMQLVKYDSESYFSHGKKGSCSGLNVCVFSTQIRVRSPSPPKVMVLTGGGHGRRVSPKGEALMAEISALVHGKPQRAPVSLPPREDTTKGCHLQIRD